MAEKIEFPQAEPENVFDRDCLAFPAWVDGKTVQCLVTAELLFGKFGARDNTWPEMLRAFEGHKSEIQSLAQEQIQNGWVDTEGRVLLTTRYTRLTVKIDPRIQGVPKTQEAIDFAVQYLKSMIGPNAEQVGIEISAGDERPEPRSAMIRITDPVIAVKANLLLPLGTRADSTSLPILLADVWGEVLVGRARRLMLKSG